MGIKYILFMFFIIVFSVSCWATSSENNSTLVQTAQPFTGWHWYNEPKPTQHKKVSKQNDVPDISKLPIEEQVKLLQGYTREALHAAILYPHDIKATEKFLKWQKFWTDHASYFAQSFQVAQLDNPDLDYNLIHSHYNSLSSVQNGMKLSKQDKAIQSIAEHFGLFYFYRGGNPIDNNMSGVVAAFAKAKGISVIPISVDGVVSASLTGTKPDTGQSKAMKVTHFPALFIVDPVRKKFRPVAYGFMTQDDLMTRFFYVATGFRPDY